MAKRIRKFVLNGLIILISTVSIFCILQLSVPHSDFLLKKSIEGQISGISDRLESNEDIGLQARYPEGYVFANAIFALSVIESHEKGLVFNQPNLMVDKCIVKLLSNDCKARFNGGLDPKYGAFYNGWTGYVLNKYIRSGLFETSMIRNKVILEFKNVQNQILDVQCDSIKLLESYGGQVWPADNVVCMSILDPGYRYLAINWFNKLPKAVDSEMICHYYESNCEVRGASQALILYFLGAMNFKTVHIYEKFRRDFVHEIAGIELVREFPLKGAEDYDSGPVIFNIGSAATLMQVKTACLYGRCSPNTWGLFNTIGFPLFLRGQKSYLLKKNMMFDIFMLWGAVSIFQSDFNL